MLLLYNRYHPLPLHLLLHRLVNQLLLLLFDRSHSHPTSKCSYYHLLRFHLCLLRLPVHRFHHHSLRSHLRRLLRLLHLAHLRLLSLPLNNLHYHLPLHCLHLRINQLHWLWFVRSHSIHKYSLLLPFLHLHLHLPFHHRRLHKLLPVHCSSTLPLLWHLRPTRVVLLQHLLRLYNHSHRLHLWYAYRHTSPLLLRWLLHCSMQKYRLLFRRCHLPLHLRYIVRYTLHCSML